MEPKSICRVNREPEASLLFAFRMASEIYPEFSNPIGHPILRELRGVGFHNASASVLVTESPSSSFENCVAADPHYCRTGFKFNC